MGRTALVTALACAIGALSTAPGAHAAAPIEGTWRFSGGQVLVRAAGSGFEGVVVSETRFGGCAHRVEERMWQIAGGGASYSGTHQWFVEDSACSRQAPGQATWRVREVEDRFVLDFCTARPGTGAPDPADELNTTCAPLERAKPPKPGSSACSGPACLALPPSLRSRGCLRRGSFSYRFPVRLRRSEARQLRVTATRFTLDWRPNGIDRRSPYVARVSGAKLTPGSHLLIADVRLRSRRSGKSLHRRLSFRFDGCG